MSANQLDAFGLRAIFAEFASTDPAINNSSINALNLGTATLGVTAGVSGGATVFKSDRTR